MLQALQQQRRVQGLLRREDQVQQQEPQQELRELCHTLNEEHGNFFLLSDLMAFLLQLQL